MAGCCEHGRKIRIPEEQLASNEQLCSMESVSPRVVLSCIMGYFLRLSVQGHHAMSKAS